MTETCVACGCEISGRHLVGMRAGPLPTVCSSRCAGVYDQHAARQGSAIPQVEKWVFRSVSMPAMPAVLYEPAHAR